MSFLGFLTKKKFYIHLGISIVVTLIILLLIFGLLKSYTRHGDVYEIPDLEGMTFDRLQSDPSTGIFNFQVIDSIFDNSKAPGSIIMQNPSAGSKAKEGRTIYITLVSYSPEMSVMPELKDLTIRQAVTTLKASGIKVGTLKFIPHFAENSVLGHYYNGDTLYAGMELLEGSEIDLVVGLGQNRETVTPFVIGMTRDQAHDVLNMASINAGRENYLDQADAAHSRVYLQIPDWNSTLLPGDSVKLYYRSDLNYNFDSLISAIKPDTAVIMETTGEIENLEDFDNE